jgi:hypothetical protein
LEPPGGESRTISRGDETDRDRKLCLSNDALTAGDLQMTRCQVNNNAGFAIGSVKFVDATGKGSETAREKIRIRNYSFLAFFRFFYEQLLEKQEAL